MGYNNNSTTPQRPSYWNSNGQHEHAPFKNQYFADKNGSSKSQRKELIVKHSGCKIHSNFTDKVTGEIVPMNFITAWNYSKSRGMLSFIASPRVDKDKRKTKHENYENWSVKIFHKRTLETTWANGFFHKIKGIIIIKDMQLVLNPKAKNGGYCGTFVNV